MCCRQRLSSSCCPRVHGNSPEEWLVEASHCLEFVERAKEWNCLQAARNRLVVYEGQYLSVVA